MVDPHHITAFQGDGIAAPYVLRVELGHMDVLDNDVGSTGNAETTTLKDTCGSRANQGLVRRDYDRVQTSFVVGDGCSRCARLVVTTPIVLVDGCIRVRICCQTVGLY